MPVITSPSGVDLLTTTYLLLTQLNPEYSWLLVVRTGFEPVRVTLGKGTFILLQQGCLPNFTSSVMYSIGTLCV
jgi:hypothetical protein